MAIDSSPVPDYASMYRLEGRSFIVAGAGQGMGRQAAHALSALGGQVYCVDVVRDRAEDVAKEVGGIVHVADGRDSGQVREVIEGARAAFGRLDGVVDVIGMARWAALVDMPEDDWDWVHGEVLRHAFHFVRFAAPVIAAGGGGSLVFVASVDGLSSRALPRRLRGGQSRAHLAGTHRGGGAQSAAGSRERGGTRWRGHPQAAPIPGDQ